jgi:hypothetical protein
MTDPLLDLLERLPSGSLDASRADRIRVRCHAALVHQRQRVNSPARSVRHWPPMAVGFGGLYVTTLVHQVLALYGLV